MTEEKEQMRQAMMRLADSDKLASITDRDINNVNTMKKALERKDEEIKLLKMTVRRECEERVELLSKLESFTSRKR